MRAKAIAIAMTLVFLSNILSAYALMVPPDGEPDDGNGEGPPDGNGEPPAMVVEIDIKPGSYPNSINLNPKSRAKSKGVVPVAVLTTAGFDASTIDPDTVLFAGAGPLRWTLEDVDGDGDVDMLFHFRRKELDLNRESTEATLTGETLDGTPFEGTDTVKIVPKRK